MKPVHTFLFSLVVFAILAVMLAVFTLFAPAEGIGWGETRMQFPTFAEMFIIDTSEEEKDLESIMFAMKEAMKQDSLARAEAAVSAEQARKDSLKAASMVIQYPEGDKSILHPFFARAYDARRAKSPVRVLHYGDSQIEGDRMTGKIRDEMQRKWGGTGPGLVPVVPVVSSISVTWSQADNMQRYTYFGARSKEVNHNRYGPLALFARYAPVVQDSFANDSIFYESWIRVNRSGNAYSTSKNYTRVRLFYGYNQSEVVLKFLADGNFISMNPLPPNEKMDVLTWDFDKTPQELTMVFEGYDSPDLYAVSLEGKSGIVVDNLAMRGSSGTLFTRMDQNLLNQAYDSLNVSLVLLQFGGNTIPYMESEKEAADYGSGIARQIRHFKSWIPGACVIVMGPADMSIKEKDEFVTHPMVPVVRDALKKAAFDAGAGYFDIYEVMGGENSMPLWVNADPPLAAPDYTHFARGGSNKIADVFIQSLFADYEEWSALRANYK